MGIAVRALYLCSVLTPPRVSQKPTNALLAPGQTSRTTMYAMRFPLSIPRTGPAPFQIIMSLDSRIPHGAEKSRPRTPMPRLCSSSVSTDQSINLSLARAARRSTHTSTKRRWRAELPHSGRPRSRQSRIDQAGPTRHVLLGRHRFFEQASERASEQAKSTGLSCGSQIGVAGFLCDVRMGAGVGWEGAAGCRWAFGGDWVQARAAAGRRVVALWLVRWVVWGALFWWARDGMGWDAGRLVVRG